jgi:hypothetical protein
MRRRLDRNTLLWLWAIASVLALGLYIIDLSGNL